LAEAFVLEAWGVVSVSKQRRVLVISAVALVALLATSIGHASAPEVGACGTGSLANTGTVSCSFVLQCDNCSFAARLHVDGVGLVGGKITASFDCGAFCLSTLRPQSDFCQHVLSCEAAVGGETPMATCGANSITVQCPVHEIRIDCEADGPAVLQHVSCSGQTEPLSKG